MSLIRPIQPTFNSGEVSPAIWSRVDISRYVSALRKCYNMIVHSDGGASNRPGLLYRAEVKDSTKATILEEFVFSEDQAYILEFGDQYVRFFTKDGQIQNVGVAYEVATPYLEADLSELRFESSADVIYIFHPDYQTRTLTRLGNANWVLAAYQPDDGPFMAENIDDSSSMTVSAVTGDTTLTVSSVIDSDLKLLMHFNGIDGTSAFIDDTGKVFTANGDAHIETDQSKFGGSSAYFDGTGDYAVSETLQTASFEPAGDFTIHFWYYNSSSVSDGVPFCYYVNGSNRWQFEFNSDGTLEFVLRKAGVDVLTLSSSSGTLQADGWHHIALSRDGNTFRLFHDGAVADSDTYAGTFIGTNGKVYLGSLDGASAMWTGYLDELVYTSDLLYTADFSGSLPTIETALTTSSGDFTFSPDHIGGLFKVRHFVEGQAVTDSIGSVRATSSIKCFTTWRLITHGTWTATISVEMSTDGGSTWTKVRQFSSADDNNVNTSGTEDIELYTNPFLVRVNMTAYTSGTCEVDLTTDAFYQDGICRVTSYISPTSVNVTMITDAHSTDETTLWSEGSWSDYRGYPSYGKFFQDRLVTACSNHEPTTFWTTVTGEYTSYYRHSSLLDTDAITDKMPGRRINKINGIIALKSLIFLTEGAEISLNLAEGVFTPTSYNKAVEAYRGSSGVEPVVIGNEALFVQKNNKTMRSVGYDFASDSFTGTDMNILARHLVKNKTITKMVYQQDPDSIIWAIRSDGVLLGCTYMREQEVIAWHKHETNGTVESIAVIPAGTFDQVWIIVNRDGGRYVESFVERLSSTVREDQIFLDSSISYSGSPASVFTGLDHLEGEVVSILADGTVHDTRTVVAGSVTLDDSYTVVHIGLGYTSDLETLNIEMNTRAGSMQGTKIKVGNVTFRLIDTIGGYIGPDFDSLYEAFDADSLAGEDDISVIDTGLATGDIRVVLGGGYSNGGRLAVRQTDPLPITISAIIPEISVGGESS